MQDDTQPIKIPYTIRPRRKPISLYIIIATLGLLVVILGILLLKSPEDESQSLTSSSLQNPGTFLEASQKIKEIDSIEAGIKQDQTEINRLADDYKNKTGKDFTSINVVNLNDREREILRELMNVEGDVSIKALLQDILEKDETIIRLKSRMLRLESLLPRPHPVRKGETHFQIAWDFLVNEKNIPPNTAKEILERTALFDAIVPGFRVWNFYANGEYGTFVTQGIADISPNEMRRRMQERLIANRNRAVKKLNQKEKEYQKRINSLYYYLDSKKNLKEKGILKSGFLQPTRLAGVSPGDFDKHIDLRKKDTIIISAARYNLKRIKKVSLYPSIFTEGADYRVNVSEDKKDVTLVILDKKKFKEQRVVFCIE